MNKTLKVYGLAVVILAAVIGAYFFFIQKNTPAISELTIGYIPIADCAQLYVGLELGYFKDAGIDLKLVSLAGGAKILEALGARSVDVGFSNVVSIILAQSQGLDYVALTGGPAEDQDHKENAILVKNDSSINSPSDLEGKIIAINTPKNIEELFVKEYLSKNNVDLSKVTFVSIPFPNMESALQSDQVHAIKSIEPYVTAAMLHGAFRVLDYNYSKVQPVTEISSYVVRRDWLQQNQDLANRFTSAFNKATDYANSHPAEVKQIVAKYTQLSSDIVNAMTLPLFTKQLSINRLQNIQDLMVKNGLLDESKVVDVAKIIIQP